MLVAPPFHKQLFELPKGDTKEKKKQVSKKPKPTHCTKNNSFVNLASSLSLNWNSSWSHQGVVMELPGHTIV